MFVSISPSGLRDDLLLVRVALLAATNVGVLTAPAVEGANLNVIIWFEAAAGAERMKSGCFLLVRFNTKFPFSFPEALSSSAASILESNGSFVGLSFLNWCFCNEGVEYDLIGDSWSITLFTSSCECDLIKFGLIGVLSTIGVGAVSVTEADTTTEESGVGGNSVISLSVLLRRRRDCLLF